MGMFRSLALFGILIASAPVFAGEVDLILPPALESADAPFYRGAQVKLGDQLMPVREGALPKGQLAAFVPEKNAVIISNKQDASQADKGRALFDVLDALEAGAIAPAAGQEE
jgi:hypothetical protein